MKWNQSKLRANFKAWAKDLNIRDFDGETAEDAVAFVKSLAEHYDIPGLVKDGELDEAAVKAAWGRKAVRVIADAGEEIIVEDGEGETAEADVEDEELKEADPDEEMEKAYKAFRKAAQKRGQKVPTFMKSVHEAGQGGQKTYLNAGSYDRMASRKRYDRKAANGETVFSSSDAAELFAAAARFSSMGVNDYANKSSDREIWQKAGATYDATLGGVLIPDAYSADMIELMPQYGTARKYAGVYSMSGPREFVSRFGADATTYKLAENGAASESTPTFNGVWLNAEEIGTLSKMPLRLLQHSAVDAADAIARSQARSRAKYEDQSFWNGANGFQGIQSKVGTSSTHTVSGASSYTDLTVTDVQTWISKLPDWTDDFEDQIGIYCHRSFDDQVFQRFGPAAGGAATVDMTTGRITHFKGIEIFHVNVMNNARTFTSGNIMAYVGPLQACTKFGEVAGTMSVRQTEQRWFEYRQWAALSSVEIAINPHDVLDDAESGLWALKVTS